ncbi:MAG TPA: sulfite exporter TauE/SafE family protein [Streptosporangiaceae bacterium]|jgi:hypothetical protein
MVASRSAVSSPPVETTGTRTIRTGTLIVVSLLVGAGIAMLWSAKLVDDDIGVNSATGILGHNSLTSGISSSGAGIVFAFIAGLAGTFTACNVAAFSAIAPLMQDAPSLGARARAALRPVGWLAVGVIVVAGLYGAIGAAFGKHIPQLSTATIGNGVHVRTLQAIGIFSVIGLIFIYLGLAAAGTVPDPLRRLTARWPHTPQLVMGALIGGFLIGRPYPLFYKMFAYAASTHDPAYGAAAFILVALGNILLMAILFLVLSMTRYQQWLQSRPGRVARFTAVALLIGGGFTLAYWGLRVPANLGYGWFPTVGW